VIDIPGWAFTVGGDGRSWFIGTLLDALFSEVFAGGSVSPLINAPFKDGEIQLELARLRPAGSLEQRQEIEKAKDLFRTASSLYEGEQKVTALCLAAVCCYMLNDQAGRYYFYNQAIAVLIATIQAEEWSHMWTTGGNFALVVLGAILSGGRPGPPVYGAERYAITSSNQRKVAIQRLKDRHADLVRCVSRYVPIQPSFRTCPSCQHQSPPYAKACANCGRLF
jgi:hypothetical protein